MIAPPPGGVFIYQKTGRTGGKHDYGKRTSRITARNTPHDVFILQTEKLYIIFKQQNETAVRALLVSLRPFSTGRHLAEAVGLFSCPEHGI